MTTELSYYLQPMVFDFRNFRRFLKTRIRDLNSEQFNQLLLRTYLLFGISPDKLPDNTDNFPAKTFFKQSLILLIGDYFLTDYEEAIILAMKRKLDFDAKLYGNQISVYWFTGLLKAYDKTKKRENNPSHEYTTLYLDMLKIPYSPVDCTAKAQKRIAERTKKINNVNLIAGIAINQNKMLTE